MGLRGGLVAGAAGTTALDTITYLDMAIRGRQSSELPAKAADELAGDAHLPLGEADAHDARTQGLGALLGYAAGLSVGAGYGLLRTVVRVPWPVAAVGLAAAAMAAGDAPLTALGLTDPRDWDGASWISDIVPHLGYGVVTALAYEMSV